MTILENVMIAFCFGKPKGGQCTLRRKEALELLDLLKLSQKADFLARELTCSELRRLEAARALATQPKLLLLDEIVTGFSPRVIDQWVELLKALRGQGLTLLIIDHFLSLTAKVSDRLIALHHGTKIAEGEPESVLSSPEVISAYLGEGRQPYWE
jgi:branched-chain amino acid transport system ATP-binding protein